MELVNIVWTLFVRHAEKMNFLSEGIQLSTGNSIQDQLWRFFRLGTAIAIPLMHTNCLSFTKYFIFYKWPLTSQYNTNNIRVVAALGLFWHWGGFDIGVVLTSGGSDIGVVPTLGWFRQRGGSNIILLIKLNQNKARVMNTIRVDFLEQNHPILDSFKTSF
jgi:hypothetical protein